MKGDAVPKSTAAIVKAYADAAQSESTKRSYAQDIRHFRQNGGKIPATPAMVAGYMARFAESHAVATLQHRLVAIRRAHVEGGHTSPTSDKLVKRTMQGIRRTKGVKQRQVKALLKDDLIEILVAVAKQNPLKAARDKAMLLVAFASALRRSELVGIKLEDITPHAHGMDIALARSKTDQEGEGRTVFVPRASVADRCPVVALEQWLEIAEIGSGSVFRRINRHDQVVSDRLSGQSVALVFKAAVRAARGVEASKDYAGHSTRAGFVTQSAIAGLQPHVIMGQTGHKSMDMVLRYIRPIHRRQIPSLL